VEGDGWVRWRGWGLVLAVLAALGGLTVAGRLLEVPDDRPARAAPAPPTTSAQVSVTTLAPGTVPAGLRRPLRLPGLRRDGSCPTSPATGPAITPAHPVAAVAVGDGPVYPVLFRAAAGNRLDPSAVAYWDAPEPLGGPAIVRGHRLGRPGDRIGFQEGQEASRPVHVLDPAAAYSNGARGRWWRPTRLRAGPGCYGLQIDGPRFSQVLVVEFG
jgi:hypothetical protein